MIGFQKAASYVRECCFCLKTGASASDKLKLVLATLALMFFDTGARLPAPDVSDPARIAIHSRPHR